jgi:glutamate racemase
VDDLMEARERPVAVFDSGIGGLPYLAAARAALPSERFVYLADREGFPYGTKTREEVRDRVLGLVGRIVGEQRPKALVIACNTASQAALEEARAAHPGLPIIGTVPAIKPAAERTRTGTIGVMATAGAVEDPYLDELVRRHAAGIKVLREPAQELVDFVERRAAYAGERERIEAVEPFVRRLVEGGADKIVLACTHFLHLRDAVAACAGPLAEPVDSREGVARRLAEILAEASLERGAESPPGRSIFLLTGEPPYEERYSLLARDFDLDGPSPLGG